MGRKVNPEKVVEVIKTIRENDGKLRANNVAKQLGLHPEEMARVLTTIENDEEKVLCEDDKGFLNIFKFW